MDIVTQRPQIRNPGIRVEEFVKVVEQISLCTEFTPLDQEGKFNNIFLLFQLCCVFSDPILVMYTSKHFYFQKHQRCS